MELGKEMPSGGSALKALDPRSEEGLPLLATLVGVFAALIFVVVLYTSLTSIIGDPIFWLLRKLPAFFYRLFMAIVMIITAAGGLISALSFVKLLHLLHGWRHQADSDSGTPSTPEA
jgi:hypothetical protein